MSVVHLVIRRCHGDNTPIKAKEQMTFHVGYRRFTACPIYSQHTNMDKHKVFEFIVLNHFWCVLLRLVQLQLHVAGMFTLAFSKISVTYTSAFINMTCLTWWKVSFLRDGIISVRRKVVLYNTICLAFSPC